MNDREKLAILTALKKAVEEKTKLVRETCNEELIEFYREEGIKKLSLRVDGKEVGEFLVTENKEGYKITDPTEFNDFALSYGFASTRKSIRPEMMASAIKFLEDNLDPEVITETIEETVEVNKDWQNFMSDGGDCVLFMDSSCVVPGVVKTPKSFKNTTVTGCKPSDVLPILNALPGGLGGLLLGDGNE